MKHSSTVQSDGLGATSWKNNPSTASPHDKSAKTVGFSGIAKDPEFRIWRKGRRGVFLGEGVFISTLKEMGQLRSAFNKLQFAKLASPIRVLGLWSRWDRRIKGKVEGTNQMGWASWAVDRLGA